MDLQARAHREINGGGMKGPNDVIAQAIKKYRPVISILRVHLRNVAGSA